MQLFVKAPRPSRRLQATAILCGRSRENHIGSPRTFTGESLRTSFLSLSISTMFTPRDFSRGFEFCVTSTSSGFASLASVGECYQSSSSDGAPGERSAQLRAPSSGLTLSHTSPTVATQNNKQNSARQPNLEPSEGFAQSDAGRTPKNSVLFLLLAWSVAIMGRSLG